MTKTAAQRPESLPGTRPVGARDEAEAAAQVREMFSRIAPRYDFLNHFLSFSLDRVWRRRVAQRFRKILAREDAGVLDLCCGTGDLAFALHAHGPARVLGSDFAHPMLVRALQKAMRKHESHGAASESKRSPLFVEADALRLPFADASFDLLAAAFGFRNLANYEYGLREIYRVLKPGGAVGILDFVEPQGKFWRPVYLFYFRKVLPWLGGRISGDATAYAYLPGSVEKFPAAEQLAALMSRVGFTDVRFDLWTLGTVALHTARR